MQRLPRKVQVLLFAAASYTHRRASVKKAARLLRSQVGFRIVLPPAIGGFRAEAAVRQTNNSCLVDGQH
jgi:hypothetical protein